MSLISGFDVRDERQCLKVFETQQLGLPKSFLRRFYVMRSFDDPSLLDYDDQENASFALYWARRYDNFVDSACSADRTTSPSDTMSSEMPDFELSPPPLRRQPTPDPRARYHERDGILTPRQRAFWEANRTIENTSSELHNPRLVNTKEVEMMEDDAMEFEFGDENLGDSMSETHKARIEHLLENLYQPESPGHHGVKGEEIVPLMPRSEEKPSLAKVKKRLSPEAEVFVPRTIKRLNTTQVEELDKRAHMPDFGDESIKEGDDALTGLNVADLDNLEDTLTNPVVPLPSSPGRRPPPRCFKKNRML